MDLVLIAIFAAWIIGRNLREQGRRGYLRLPVTSDDDADWLDTSPRGVEYATDLRWRHHLSDPMS